MLNLFSRIAGVFCRAAEPDIEEDFDPLDDAVWEDEDEDDFDIPEDCDPLDQGRE